MDLVLFDLDGTLTDTNAVDTLALLQAAREVLGVTHPDTDWTHYENPTDQGILNTLFRDLHARPPTEPEVRQFQARFFEILDIEAGRNPDAFRPMPGAVELLERLAVHPHARAALATGAWQGSARIKLAAAGIPVTLFVSFANADLAPARHEIMAKAEAMALGELGIKAFESRTYVGDGVWDAMASKTAGYRFIGIGRGEQADSLAQAGAERVFPDYSDAGEFLSVVLGRGQGLQ